ncbi:MAG: biopolymer transporter ExbD [Myxococcales bacterium]
MTSSQGSGIIAGINVTPLVDVMLVLLVIFMVTMTVAATPAVPLDLPRASQTEEVQVVFSVVLPSAGPTLVNGEPAASDAVFARRAQDALSRDPHTRAVIDADGAVSHRRVLHTLDLLKAAGIVRVAFGAQPADGARAE